MMNSKQKEMGIIFYQIIQFSHKEWFTFTDRLDSDIFHDGSLSQNLIQIYT
jgi:hypothetical protein